MRFLASVDGSQAKQPSENFLTPDSIDLVHASNKTSIIAFFKTPQFLSPLRFVQRGSLMWFVRFRTGAYFVLSFSLPWTPFRRSAVMCASLAIQGSPLRARNTRLQDERASQPAFEQHHEMERGLRW
jgi:hypothetical protein